MTLVLATDPKRPGDGVKQYFIRTAKNADEHHQTQVIKNWVDREKELYRIDIHDKGVLFGQQFYNGKSNEGYLIYYYTGTPTCRIYNQKADILENWNDNKYAGIGHSITYPNLECYMWSGTGENICTEFASVKDNIPVEVACRGVVMSLYKDFKTGPDSIPKNTFDLPIDKNICQKSTDPVK